MSSSGTLMAISTVLIISAFCVPLDTLQRHFNGNFNCFDHFCPLSADGYLPAALKRQYQLF